MMDKLLIKDYRCENCGRLLFRAHIPNVPGFYIEVRCYYSGCRQVTVIRPAPPEPDAVRVEIIQTTQSEEEESRDVAIPITVTSSLRMSNPAVPRSLGIDSSL